MTRPYRWAGICLAFWFTVTTATGQISSTAPLSGSVSDPSGALIPGASVLVTNNATSARFETITIENGTFTVPALTPGVYTVTVSLPSFKQAIIPDVRINAGTPANVRVVLQVGAVTESITVEAGTELLQTQTATVSTTVDMRQVLSLPVSRDGLAMVTLLAGINSTGDFRASRVNGLSREAINITIDGVNTQEYLKDTDFFSYVSPRTDALEEVTVSTAAAGADATGQGAVHVKMVTRQGSNQFHGGVYEFHRNAALNSNSWFNNRDLATVNGKAPRPRQIQNQYGFKLGGPIIRDRAFFFVNYEESRVPSQIARTRLVLTPEAQAGVFRYTANANNPVNLLQLAAQNGHTATVDPVIGKLLQDIRTAADGVGGLTQEPEPTLQRLRLLNRAESKNRFPTFRFDVNVTDRHHVETSYWYQRFNSFPDTTNSIDPAFPGFPNTGGQSSDRYTYSLALRSTLTPRLVNEARIGLSGGTVRFRPEVSKAQFVGDVANQAGFNLQISAAGIANATTSATASRRNTPNRTISDTLNWQKDTHNLSMGGTFTQSNSYQVAVTAVPQISFGVDTNDPAVAMFTTANFTGASTTDLTRARNIYAVLTGRVTAITGNATVDEKTGEFSYLADDIDRGRQRELGLFVSDSWRARSNLTLNYGLRWEVQSPYIAQNNRYSQTTIEGLYGVSGPGNLFKPGVFTGTRTAFTALQPGEPVYDDDWMNLAPSVGFAWTPKVNGGWLKRLTGESFVFRGGYSIAFIRRSNSLFNEGYDGNPGNQITLTRNVTNGNLGTLPLLLREPQRLGPGTIPNKPEFPFTTYEATNDANVFVPDFKMPYVQSYTLGVQRQLGRDSVLEVRYVGNFSIKRSETVNLNEVNLLENGFMDEFKVAMANLQSNLAANRGSTFRYAGPGTGTAPLPILLGFLTGSTNAVDPNAYTAATFSNTTLVNRLAINNPVPYTLASDIYNDATRRRNGTNAGMASNFFFVNPDLDDVNMIRNGGYTRYNSVAVEFRKRMSRGLAMNSSYVFSKTMVGNFLSLRRNRINGVSVTTSPNIPQVWKADFIYDLPLGSGHWLMGNAGGTLQKIVSGWQVSGTSRIQSGDPIDLGNVRLVGMTRKDLQQALNLQFDDAARRVYSMPEDIRVNTNRANNVSITGVGGYSSQGIPEGRYIAPANSRDCLEHYDGDCGASSVVVYGPRFIVFDLAASKRTRITEKIDFEIRAEMFNAFNNTNFTVGLTNFATTFGQVTAADGARAVQLTGRINF